MLSNRKYEKMHADRVVPVLLIVALAFCFGFTWPWEAKKEDSQQTSLPKEEKARFVWPWEKAQEQQQQKEEEEEPEWETRVVPKGESPTVPVAEPMIAPPARAVARPEAAAQRSVPRPAPTAQRLPGNAQAGAPPSVSDVQRELTELIQLNETIRQTQQGQVKSAQQIIEQARIHQRILDDLNAADPAVRNVQPTDAQEILRQEKLRLIREQTERNRRIIESLNQNR